jgi:CBS domain-containing protein
MSHPESKAPESKAHAAKENALHRVKELTNAVKDLLRDAQGKSEFSHPVKSIMKESPATCSPADTLRRAAEILWQCDCGMVPVVEGDARLVGVLTDRDICMAAFFKGESLSTLDVGSTMSKNLHAAKPDATIESVVHLMSEKQTRRVPIVEGDRLVGIVSLADIARLVKATESVSAYRALAQLVAALSERRVEAVAGSEPKAAE